MGKIMLHKQFVLKEEKENEYDSVFEVHGNVSEVTINKLLDHLEFTTKKKTESITQLALDNSKNEEIEKQMPMLKDLSVDVLTEIMNYCTRRITKAEYESLIKACDDTIDSYTGYLKEIEEEFCIEMPAHVKTLIEENGK